MPSSAATPARRSAPSAHKHTRGARGSAPRPRTTSEGRSVPNLFAVVSPPPAFEPARGDDRTRISRGFAFGGKRDVGAFRLRAVDSARRASPPPVTDPPASPSTPSPGASRDRTSPSPGPRAQSASAHGGERTCHTFSARLARVSARGTGRRTRFRAEGTAFVSIHVDRALAPARYALSLREPRGTSDAARGTRNVTLSKRS